MSAFLSGCKVCLLDQHLDSIHRDDLKHLWCGIETALQMLMNDGLQRVSIVSRDTASIPVQEEHAVAFICVLVLYFLIHFGVMPFELASLPFVSCSRGSAREHKILGTKQAKNVSAFMAVRMGPCQQLLWLCRFEFTRNHSYIADPAHHSGLQATLNT